MATATKSAGLAAIENIVVVMLENRSFDHMLGYLYSTSGNKSPLGQPFDGLTGKESNPDSKGKPVVVSPIKATDPHPYFMPGSDPGEGFLNTNSQLFGTTQPKPGAVATNQGFVTNFDYTLGWQAKDPSWAKQILPGTAAPDIMKMYTPELLPVLSALARGYAVSDRYFASAPTETLPNRAFVQMATSQGHLDDHTKSYTAPSIYPALEKAGATWSVYGYDDQPLTPADIEDIKNAPKSHFGLFKDFAAAVSSGKLANYSFLEPQWSAQGNSQHPDYDVALGEQFLLQVYRTLYNSKVWTKTLLIVTYDEHGGYYDHVVPPANATPPDNSVGEFGFDFKRFGVRVPAVFVSPFIAAGTVLRPPAGVPFDHTSILATIEKRWKLKPLTKRDAAAPDLSAVLTLSIARTDDPLAKVKAPSSSATPHAAVAPAGPDHLEQVYADSVSRLPVPDEKGHAHPQEVDRFATGKEAMAWAHKRYAEFNKRKKK
ncbi:MAG: phospholipase [Thermoanaerobaculia bacterium]|nr:phospholipase [Thermoanaerobaculia bacterium]